MPQKFLTMAEGVTADLDALKRERGRERITGERIGGPPVTSEADHFYTCVKCGQAVDMRELGQVFHHEQAEHEPLPLDS